MLSSDPLRLCWLNKIIVVTENGPDLSRPILTQIRNRLDRDGVDHSLEIDQLIRPVVFETSPFFENESDNLHFFIEKAESAPSDQQEAYLLEDILGSSENEPSHEEVFLLRVDVVDPAFDPYEQAAFPQHVEKRDTI